MKINHALLLLLVIPCLAIASDLEVVNPVSRTAAPDYLQFTPASFRKHPPAQMQLERGKIDHRLLSAAVFHATNVQRARRGLPPLVHSEALRRAAQIHTHDMAAGGFFAHQNPKNPSRKSPWQRTAAQGVTGGRQAENIAKTSAARHTYLSAADAIVTMWMKSPGHRRNILDPGMRRLGCGVHACRCPHFHLLATQNFASEEPN